MYISVKLRLILMLVIPLVIFAGTAVYLLQLISSNTEKLSDSLYETSYQSSSLIISADRDMYQALTDYQRLRYVKLSGEEKKTVLADYRSKVKLVNANVTQAMAIIQAHHLEGLTHPESKVKITDIITQFKNGFNVWSMQASVTIESPTLNMEQEDALLAKFEQGRSSVGSFGEILNHYAQSQTEEIRSNTRATNATVYTVLFIVWIVFILAGAYLILGLNRTIRNVLNKSKLVSVGNLQYEPQSAYGKDELGQINASMDTMILKIRDLVGSISEHTRTVASSSDALVITAGESAAATTHVAENIQDVTAQVEVQSTIAEESSKAMEEMAIGVQRIAENTTGIADHTSATSNQVDQGNARVQTLKQQLGDILEAIRMLSSIVSSLTVKSDQIGKITSNITDFANKTNILSLNASIEAARAGEHGRGFAVVAQEIRILAANSLESASVISGLISETREEISNASLYMDTTLTQTEVGSQMMQAVEQDFNAILQSIRMVATQVHETSAITEQMSASSEEVSASMDQASSSAQEIAGKAQMVAAATEEQLALGENITYAASQLQEIVQRLNQAVSTFKL